MNLTFNDFYGGLGDMASKKRLVILSVSLGVVSWLLTIMMHFFLSQSLGMDITYFTLLSIMPIVTLLDTLPISFSGIGTREIALIFFLSMLGIETEAIVSLSLLVLIFGYFLVGIAGFVFWIRKPIRISE